MLNVLKSRYKQNENEIDEKLCRKICRDAYPSLEEKAVNLLYFMIKDHPYSDVCKRIAASLFLEFLEKNNALFKDGDKRISDGALVALTLMIAESRPDEKD